jgi:hypothetical protein
MSVGPLASAEVTSDEWKYQGIGGWLILVAIGLCVSPILQVLTIATSLVPIFTNGSWNVLTTPRSPAYHPLWAAVIPLELVMNVVFIAAEVLLLVWFFGKSRRFPAAMIVYLFVVFAFVALDYFLAQAIPAVAEQNDAESRGAFVRAGVSCAIWMPYFARSKRVKATFIN